MREPTEEIGVESVLGVEVVGRWRLGAVETLLVVGKEEVVRRGLLCCVTRGCEGSLIRLFHAANEHVDLLSKGGNTGDHCQLSFRNRGNSGGCFGVFLSKITVLSLESFHSRSKGLELRHQGGDSFA